MKGYLHPNDHSSTVHNNQDTEATPTSTDRGMAKGREEYNAILAIKKNEMSFATTWMNLEIVILREVSQTEKTKYGMTSLLYGI